VEREGGGKAKCRGKVALMNRAGAKKKRKKDQGLTSRPVDLEVQLAGGDDLKPCCSERSGAPLGVRTFTLVGRVVHIYPEDSVAYRTLLCTRSRHRPDRSQLRGSLRLNLG
jgi:hypothetical protein